MTKAIISAYSEITVDGETRNVPNAVIDTGALDFESSDIPSSYIDGRSGERLIFLDEAAHAQAVNIGYTEVDVQWPL